MEKHLQKFLNGGKFIDVPPERSKTMSAIRSTGNMTTEARLRFVLVRRGIRGWNLHPHDIPGKPDFYFPQSRVAIFVDGCFWHGCPKCGHIPSTRRAFWNAKIDRNQERDRTTMQVLEREGFRVLRFWEHELKDNITDCVLRIRDTLKK